MPIRERWRRDRGRRTRTLRKTGEIRLPTIVWYSFQTQTVSKTVGVDMKDLRGVMWTNITQENCRPGTTKVICRRLMTYDYGDY